MHAGDLTKQGTFDELRKTLEWIEKADFEIKIVVAGTVLTSSFSSYLLKSQVTMILHWMKNSTLSTRLISITSTHRYQRTVSNCYATPLRSYISTMKVSTSD